jgi:iron complex transport system substrate-binding protein
MSGLRKALLAGLLTVGVALALAGCGNSGEGADSPPAAAGTSPAAAETKSPDSSPAKTTRMYTDASGRQVEIPVTPERIVAHFYAPELVSLESKFVGTNFANAKLVLSEKQLEGVEDIGASTGAAPNTEKILALDPDIIIIPDFLDATSVEALGKIAPVVTMKYSGDVFSRITELGDIIGKKEKAAAWVKQYNDKAARKKADLASMVEKGETATAFVVFQDKLLYVYGPQRLGPTMYDALGFKAPQAVEKLFAAAPDKLWLTISQETLPEYAGDHIFLVTQDANEASRKGVEELLQSPIWKSLPAVKNGHAHVVNNRWAFNDSVTLEWLLEEMPKVLKP